MDGDTAAGTCRGKGRSCNRDYCIVLYVVLSKISTHVVFQVSLVQYVYRPSPLFPTLFQVHDFF